MFETKHLILREWKDEDIALFAAMNQDPQVMKFFPSTLAPEESTSRVDWQRRHFKQHGFCCFAVELKATGEFIGFVGLSIPTFEAHFTPCVEIGWRIAAKYWNHGYATEAARAVLHAAFEKYGLKEVVSFTATINKPSIRVMEKLGMKHDPCDDFDHPALPKDHPLSRHVLYRYTAEQLKAQDTIEIAPCHPEWIKAAEQEIAILQAQCDFPWVRGMQHIGSTAIPELAAKPIIDIAIGVSDLERAKALIPILQQQDYIFWESNPDTTKLFFVKGMPPFGERRTHHIHVMNINHHDWIVRPLFRDYLIAHADVKQAYADLKQKLALQFGEDREGYTESKTRFIRSINAKAIIPYLHFESLSEQHFPLLLQWFNEPHVQEFYSLQNWTLEEVETKYLPRLQLDSAVKCFIIMVQNILIGFIQTYAREYEKGAVGIDFSIGNATFLYKGLGGVILNAFIKALHLENSTLVADPDTRNQAAIRILIQCGFVRGKVIDTYNDLRQAVQLQEMVKSFREKSLE